MHLEWGTIVKSINWTFVFNLINFALLLWLLKRLVYRPALRWLDARRAREEERLAKAREAEEAARKLAQEREEALAQANRKAQRILEEAEAQAQKILKEARAEARLQAQHILQEAQASAARAVDEALAELRRSYAELVVLGASQVLEREVRPEDHRRLLSELSQRIDARLLS
ncbi:MAG: ATPase, F0 complex, subunit B, bacterial [Acetothermia bacterium 64_32]|nr:MAG: ATPase, F0 complex, subunit B, bacterial [Acetothermia bacterium 64_32]HAF70216.1 ATP synthase F0 subunit B [Candidatus Acetothermia bacterium]